MNVYYYVYRIGQKKKMKTETEAERLTEKCQYFRNSCCVDHQRQEHNSTQVKEYLKNSYST